MPCRRDFVVMITSSGSESGTGNGIDDLLLTIPDGLTSSLDSELFFRCTSTLKSMTNLNIIDYFGALKHTLGVNFFFRFLRFHTKWA